MKKIFTCILFLILTTSAFSGEFVLTTLKAKPVGVFKLGIGSSLNIKTSEKSLSGEQVFLGDVVHADGTPMYKMLLSKSEKKVHFIDNDFFSKQLRDLQTLIDPYVQVGSTCTGYAINGFLHQTNLAGFVGTNALSSELKSEEGRSQLLAHAISEYYLTPAHRYSIRGILNSYGKKYGFNCKLLKPDTFLKAKTFILGHLAKGLPVMVSFNIGPEMYNSPFPLEMFDKKDVNIDERLWLPRKVGERNNGGHTIVAAGSFEVEGKTYLTMLDSDWNEPRVWDLDQSLNHPKTALDEIELVSCE